MLLGCSRYSTFCWTPIHFYFHKEIVLARFHWKALYCLTRLCNSRDTLTTKQMLSASCMKKTLFIKLYWSKIDEHDRRVKEGDGIERYILKEKWNVEPSSTRDLETSLGLVALGSFVRLLCVINMIKVTSRPVLTRTTSLFSILSKDFS